MGPVPQPPGRSRLSRWAHSTRVWLGTLIGAVVTAVVISVVVSKVNPGPGPTPTPSRTVVVGPTGTPTGSSPAGDLSGAGPPGWSATPVSSRNDFVAVTAAMSPADGCNGGVSWLFPGASPGTLKALSVTSDFSAVDSWAKAQRGIPLAGNSIRMTVLALNGRTVLITDFGVRVVRKAAPARGIIAGLTGGCGGLTPALFAADLDRPNVVAKPIAGKDAAGKAIPPAPMPHQVSESSPEVWVLRVDTAGCDCQFIPYFDWTSGTSSGRYEVTLADQAPWRVTARGSTKVVFRTDTAGHWG